MQWTRENYLLEKGEVLFKKDFPLYKCLFLINFIFLISCFIKENFIFKVQCNFQKEGCTASHSYFSKNKS